VSLSSRIAGKREFTVLEVDGVPRPAGDLPGHLTGSVRVDDAFIPTHGVTVVAGRGIGVADLAPGRRVAVVDEWFVRHVLGGRDAVGMRFRDVPEREGKGTPGPWYEIVGVVRDLVLRPDRTAEDGVVYRAWTPEGTEALYATVRVRGDPRAFTSRLRLLSAEADPTLRLTDVMAMRDLGEEDRVALRFLSRVLAILGALALLLATAGIHSLMSFTVARRTREIGIRTAVGASPGRVVSGIFSRAFAQLGIGVIAGSIPGFLLFSYGAPEVATGAGAALGVAAFVGVAIFMLTVGLLSSAVPMRRALRIQPTEALRAE
jgi:hypothetical protein